MLLSFTLDLKHEAFLSAPVKNTESTGSCGCIGEVSIMQNVYCA